MVAERLAPGPKQSGGQTQWRLATAIWKSLLRFIGSGVTKVARQIEFGDGERPLPDRGSDLDVDCVRSRPGLAGWATKFDSWWNIDAHPRTSALDRGIGTILLHTL